MALRSGSPCRHHLRSIALRCGGAAESHNFPNGHQHGPWYERIPGVPTRQWPRHRPSLRGSPGNSRMCSPRRRCAVDGVGGCIRVGSRCGRVVGHAQGHCWWAYQRLNICGSRLTLIRPPLSSGQTGNVTGAGSLPRVRRTRRRFRWWCADFISSAVSDSVVCTKHLSRLDLATRKMNGVVRAGPHKRSPRPRNASVPSYRPIQRGRALARDQSQ